MKTIKISPVPGTTLAENKDDAARLRDDVVLPALAEGEGVRLDFGGIETATQSYVHALVAEAVRRYGDRAFDLLEFKHCAPGVQHIVRTVFEYTLLAQANAAGDGVEEESDADGI